VGINAKAIVYGFVALSIAIFGFHVYSIFFILNAIALTIALYVANSIVVGRGLKQLLSVFITSLFAIIVFNLSFSFFQQLIALGISFFCLLALIKYFLIKNHDSGWFGALCTEILGFLILFMIELSLIAMITVFFSGNF
jgi:hypothetical protein